MLTLACYNVNSIRARLDWVLEWLGRTTYDVVCLQERKVPDEQFPCEGFEAAGWHCAVHGQRTYNGVAILSRTPLSVLATPALAGCCHSTHVDCDERKGKLPSDHAPVVASFTGA